MSESQLGSEEVKTIESPSPSSTTSGQATSSEEQPSSRAKGDSRVHRTAAQVVLLGAFGLDMLLYSLVIPFLPGEAQRLGASPLVTGALFAMYAAGIFAATPLAAWLTDHLGPRRTLLWGLLALAASTLLFAFSPTLALGLPGLFVARATQGVASALAWTAGLAVLVQLYSSEERPRLFARAFTVTGLAVLLGPPLGGVLYTLGGFTLPFLVAAGLVVLDGLGRLLFLPGNQQLPATHPEQGATRILLGDAGFRMGLFATVAGGLALSALEPVTPLLLGAVFGMPSWGIGVAFGALALCFVLMQPLVSRSERRRSTKQTIRAGLIVAALSFAGTAFAASAHLGVLSDLWDIWRGWNVSLNLILVLVLLALIGCALAFVLIPAPEVLTQRGQQLAAPNGAAYGAIYAAYNAAYAFGTLLGPLATGGAVAASGVTYSFGLLALAPALGALILLIWKVRLSDGTANIDVSAAEKTGEEAVSEPAGEETGEEANEPADEGTAEETDEEPNENADEAVSEPVDAGTDEEANENAGEASDESANETADEGAGEEIGEEANENVGEDAGEETGEEANENAGEASDEEASENVDEDAGEEASGNADEAASEAVDENVGEEANEKALDGANEEVGERE